MSSLIHLLSPDVEPESGPVPDLPRRAFLAQLGLSQRMP